MLIRTAFAIASYVLGATASAQTALPDSAEVLLQYQKEQQRVVPQFAKAYGGTSAAALAPLRAQSTAK
jgi:hypothetical protein